MTALAPFNPPGLPPVTLVTALSQARDLSDDDYRRIFDEQLALAGSLRRLEVRLGSAVTFGWWAKYNDGRATLDHARRNELRAAAGLPLLPPTVAEALAAVHPDAAVYHVGRAVPTRVILVGADAPAQLALRVNGSVEAVLPAATAPQNALPGRCNARYTPRAAQKALRVAPATFDRLSAARKASGLTWDAFLSQLLGE